MKTGVILLNHGAADSPDGVETFLRNIFRDRDIIQLPGGTSMGRRLGNFIAKRRAPKVVALYRYMGGGSPLITYMHAQAAKLETELGGEIPVYLGLRYFPPYIAAALRRAIADGCERVVVFPQYPQFSTTTVGSVRAEFEAARASVAGADSLEVVEVEPFGSDPRYIALVADRVADAARRFDATPTLLFSAHSIPMQFVEAGDPYPTDVNTQATQIASVAGFSDCEVAFQSRSGPVRWLEPELVDHVDALLEAGHRHLLVVPISFVQDHLETLVELDVELGARVQAAGAVMVRVRPPNGSDAFAAFSAELVREAVSQHELSPSAVGT